jgi:O-succinylbenzoate synthase
VKKKFQEELLRITGAELRLCKIPLIEPFETSLGRETDKEVIILQLKSDSWVGYGECVAGSLPRYSYETVKTAWHILKDFIIPQVLEREIKDPESFHSLLGHIRGHQMAKACAEMSFWDLFAKSKGVPLSRQIGGRKKKIKSGVSIGIQENISALLNIIEKHLKEGYPRIKIKIKSGWDLEVVEKVRKKFPHIRLMVDANGTYTLDDLLVFKKLDSYNLMMIEQPLSHEDLVEHSILQEEIKTPICLDESIKSYHHAEEALDFNSCRVINIKPGRVGGIYISKKISELCRDRGVPVWCGGMLETGIGRAHNVHLASLPAFTLPNDISENKRYYQNDLTKTLFTLNRDGTITIPKKPGIGVEVDEKRLEEVTKKKLTF